MGAPAQGAQGAHEAQGHDEGAHHGGDARGALTVPLGIDETMRVGRCGSEVVVIFMSLALCVLCVPVRDLTRCHALSGSGSGV